MKSLNTGRQGLKALPLVCLLGLLQACGLEQVEIPELSGPSALSLNLLLKANPDFLVADNESISEVSATLRGPNGQPVAGRGILFNITDAGGSPAHLGELSSITGQVIANGQSATAVTDGSGVARVNLSAPARTDLISQTTVLVAGRVIGDDANAGLYKTVRVEIVPAEPRLFPPSPENDAPTCAFVVQPVKTSYGIGEQILFQAAASDTDGRIVRYEWDFGDGSALDLKPDVNHAYTATGSYLPILTVVDNNGATSFCGLAASGSGLTAIVVK